MFAGWTHPRFSFRIQIPDSFPLTDRIDGKYSKSFFHIIENHMLIGLTPEPGLGVSTAKQDRRKGFFRSEEHTSELQSRGHLVCRLLLEKKKILKVIRKSEPDEEFKYDVLLQEN